MAVSCLLAPTVSEVVEGETAIDTSVALGVVVGSETVISELPVTWLKSALMVLVPAAMAVTWPELVIVATLAELDVHDTSFVISILVPSL